MSTFEDIFCSQCNCKTDQALMLSCEHNLCMNCAAKHLSQENPQASNSKQYIICDLCGSKTEIDNETSREILSTVLKNLNLNPNLLNQRINNSQNNTFSENLNPNLNINTNPNNIMSNNEIIYNTMNIPNNNNISFNNGAYDMNNYNNNLLISNSNIVNQKNICREHGEPISYLCLDCMSKCICSECIVHGIHRNHDVLNIKKAYPLIYSKTQDLHKFISDKISELNLSKRNIEQKKSNIGALNQKCKNEIKNAFQIIRIRLNEKEKEIIEKTESTLKDNLNELNTYVHVIQGKITTLNKIIDSLNAHLMRKDELTLINYYCDNKNNILSQIESNENKNVFNINTISDLKINIDKSSFDNMLISLNNLDFEINRIKGVDISNQFDGGKYTAQRNLYGMDYKNRISNENPMNLNLNMYNNDKMYENKYNGNRNLKTELPRRINKSQEKKRTVSAKRKKK